VSAAARLDQLARGPAERRRRRDIVARLEHLFQCHPRAVVVFALSLFAATFVARLVIPDRSALIANFYTIPIAILACQFGLRAGFAAAVLAFALVFAWTTVDTVHLGVLGYASRDAVFVVVGGVVGRYAEQLHGDIATRERAQHDLAVYTDEVERSNERLAQSVTRLEAYAEIARTVGGETDLERVLALILKHGLEIVGTRGLLVCLKEGERLTVVRGSTIADSNLPASLAAAGSPYTTLFGPGNTLRLNRAEHGPALDVLARGAAGAIAVPLVFRGDVLGVLVGIDPPVADALEGEVEELMTSVAACAAIAVSTARSVATDRLRASIEAAEEARGRWARELHDETVQGLGGVCMILSSALQRADSDGHRIAMEAANEHLGVELQQLRALVAELRPAALDDLGLGPAITTLIERHAAAGSFEVRSEIELGDARLARETESAVYRILQEALTNAAKHSRADRVDVTMRRQPDRIQVDVHDDGTGFDPRATNSGFGLVGMRERAVLAGGSLTVASAPGGPTKITAVLPLAPVDHMKRVVLSGLASAG
jgi:signal transduction histidine kinase